MRTDPRIEAHGFTQSPLGQAASEVDRLRGQVAHLQDALDAIERTVDFVPKDEPLSAWVERAVKERDEAQAACAEMRKALEKLFVHALEMIRDYRKRDFDLCKLAALDLQSVEDQMERAQHALSTDCGKGWLSPEVAGELVGALESAVNALNEVVAYSSCDCDIPNGKTCPACQCAMATEQARKALSRAKEALV